MIFESFYWGSTVPMKFIGSTWIIMSSTQQTFQPDLTWEYLIKLEKLLAAFFEKGKFIGVTQIKWKLSNYLLDWDNKQWQ